MTRSLALETTGKEKSLNIHVLVLYVLLVHYFFQGDLVLCRHPTG